MTEEELFQKFGVKLLHAITLLIATEINTIRKELGLPTYSKEEILRAIEEKLNSIPDYEWLKRLKEEI